jgi:hypothetical protein
MAASRDDWFTTPLPTAREAVVLDRTYSAAEFERRKEGHLPLAMEDRWFVFYDEPWLCLHRSWTGFCWFQVQFFRADSAGDSRLLATLLDCYAGRPSPDTWSPFTDHLPSDRDRG